MNNFEVHKISKDQSGKRTTFWFNVVDNSTKSELGKLGIILNYNNEPPTIHPRYEEFEKGFLTENIKDTLSDLAIEQLR